MGFPCRGAGNTTRSVQAHNNIIATSRYCAASVCLCVCAAGGRGHARALYERLPIVLILTQVQVNDNSLPSGFYPRSGL